MTTPHGHSDWQQIVNTSSPNLLSGPGTVFPVGHNKTPVIPCANWGSITAEIRPTAGTGVLIINHWLDSAGTLSAGNDAWRVNTNTAVNVRSPLRATYVQLDTLVTSAGAMTADAQAFFQSTTADRLSFPVGFQGASDLAKTLAASASINYFPPFIASGRAWLWFNPNDASGKLSCVLYGSDEKGIAFEVLAKLVTTTPPIAQLLEVPDAPLILQVINGDGAAPHTFDISLTIPPQ
jgi:hypothetical protein